MKVNEFVKKHGWEDVINAVKSTNAEETAAFESKDLDPILAKDGSVLGFNVKIHNISYVDVKRLVESWELVESKGGLECAKKEFRQRSIVRWVNPEVEALRSAIADIESCGEEVKDNA